MGATSILTYTNHEKEYYFDNFPVLFKQGEKTTGGLLL